MTEQIQQLIEIDTYLNKAWVLAIDLELPNSKGRYFKSQLCQNLCNASKSRRGLEAQLTQQNNQEDITNEL